MRESALKGITLILILIFLFGIALGEDDPDDLTIRDLWDEEVEEVNLDEPMPAVDREYHTPNERTGTVCDHDTCFWKLNMGEMNETAIWNVLTQPMTVLKGKQREQIKVRLKPEKSCKDYTGVVTCASQAVHVLESRDDWTLIEAYSSCEEGSSVKV